jgi:hypothetical protein
MRKPAHPQNRHRSSQLPLLTPHDLAHVAGAGDPPVVVAKRTEVKDSHDRLGPS